MIETNYSKIEFFLNKTIVPKYDYLRSISINFYSGLNPQPYMIFHFNKRTPSIFQAESLMEDVQNLVLQYFDVYMRAYYNNDRRD